MDDADAMTSDEQAVEGLVRRKVKVNRARGRAAASRAGDDLAAPVATIRGRNVGQGRAVAVPMEDREPQMGLVSTSTAWQMDFGMGNSCLCLRLCWVANRCACSGMKLCVVLFLLFDK